MEEHPTIKRIMAVPMEMVAVGYVQIIFAILAIVAAAAGAYAQVQSGKAQKKTAQAQSDYMQSQADAEAKQARAEAQWAEYRITVNEQQAEIKKRETKQKAIEDMSRARVARKGISSDSGTLLAEEIASISDLGYTLDLIDWETQIESANITKEKGSYNYRAALAESQGEWAREMGTFTGNQAITQSRYAAGSSLLAGGAQAAGAYSDKNSVQSVKIVKE